MTITNNYSMAIATTDMSACDKLIHAALNRHASVKQIIHTLQVVVEGHYNTRGFDGNNTDLIALVHHLGGSKLLHAVLHATGLPSLHTLKRKQKFTLIRPCVASIEASEIDYNLKSLFW